MYLCTKSNRLILFLQILLKALVLALFAYMGTELIGVTVGEAKNPRKTVPSAIKKTFVSRNGFGMTRRELPTETGALCFSGVSCSSTSSVSSSLV